MQVCSHVRAGPASSESGCVLQVLDNPSRKSWKAPRGLALRLVSGSHNLHRQPATKWKRRWRCAGVRNPPTSCGFFRAAEWGKTGTWRCWLRPPASTTKSPDKAAIKAHCEQPSQFTTFDAGRCGTSFPPAENCATFYNVARMRHMGNAVPRPSIMLLRPTHADGQPRRATPESGGQHRRAHACLRASRALELD